jgi:hypothetical protein
MQLCNVPNLFSFLGCMHAISGESSEVAKRGGRGPGKALDEDTLRLCLCFCFGYVAAYHPSSPSQPSTRHLSRIVRLTYPRSNSRLLSDLGHACTLRLLRPAVGMQYAGPEPAPDPAPGKGMEGWVAGERARGRGDGRMDGGLVSGIGVTLRCVGLVSGE